MKKLAIDIGNVLVNVDLNKFTNIFNSKKISGFRFLELIQAEHEIGLLTFADYLEKYESREHEFEKAWLDTVTPNQFMINWLQDLQKNNYEIAILSNIGQDHHEHLNKICPPLFNNNILHLSYQVGARKPTKIYFQSFLLENPQFKNCLFIDDRIENLNMASKFGFRTYQFSLLDFDKKSFVEKNQELNNINL